jgi:hypothetical protein
LFRFTLFNDIFSRKSSFDIASVLAGRNWDRRLGSRQIRRFPQNLAADASEAAPQTGEI